MLKEEALIAQSLDDLKKDLSFLLFVTKTAGERVHTLQKKLSAQSASFPEEVRQLLLISLQPIAERYQSLFRALQKGLQNVREDQASYAEKLVLKHRSANELRALQSICAGIRTAGDWQSPSYDHSLVSRAGNRTGTIEGTCNDYTRDYHSYAEDYEQRFVQAYIDGFPQVLVRARLTVSGMAAFTTAVACVHEAIGPDDCVFASEGIYFQNKRVLLQHFGKRVRWVDEMRIEELLDAVHREQPAALFFDTLGNTPAMALPHLEKIIAVLSRMIQRPTFLVLDNSTRATSFQPLKFIPLFSKLQLLVIESLNKYYQFGFDRVTAGVVWTVGKLAGKVFSARMNLGTNISDVSALALIEPNRALLEGRLARIQRNVLLLAQAIEAFLQSFPMSRIDHVVYPGLPSHPSFTWAEKESFCGGYFILQFKPDFSHVSTYERFLAVLMKLAKKRKIDLTAGTSFGFDTTRIYLTARHASKECQPFVRISPGTETLLEMERIKELFFEAMRE